MLSSLLNVMLTLSYKGSRKKVLFLVAGPLRKRGGEKKFVAVEKFNIFLKTTYPNINISLLVFYVVGPQTGFLKHLP